MSQVWKFGSLCQVLSIKSSREKDEYFGKKKEIKNDKYIPTSRRINNQEEDLSMKKDFAAIGDLLEE